MRRARNLIMHSQRQKNYMYCHNMSAALYKLNSLSLCLQNVWGFNKFEEEYPLKDEWR